MLEIADGLIFNSLFTMVYRVIQSWSKNKEGRHYLLASGAFTFVALGLFALFKN